MIVHSESHDVDPIQDPFGYTNHRIRMARFRSTFRSSVVYSDVSLFWKIGLIKGNRSTVPEKKVEKVRPRMSRWDFLDPTIRSTDIQNRGTSGKPPGDGSVPPELERGYFGPELHPLCEH